MQRPPLAGEAVGKNPVDRRKIGTKRHLCVDPNGIVFGLIVSAANQHDNQLLQKVIESMPIKLKHLHVMCAADSAYDAKNS